MHVMKLAAITAFTILGIGLFINEAFSDPVKNKLSKECIVKDGISEYGSFLELVVYPFRGVVLNLYTHKPHAEGIIGFKYGDDYHFSLVMESTNNYHNTLTYVFSGDNGKRTRLFKGFYEQKEITVLYTDKTVETFITRAAKRGCFTAENV